VPGGAAAAAGVRVGDYLVRLGDVQVRDDGFGAEFRERYAGEPEDTPLGLVVRRNGNPKVLDLRLRFSEDVNVTIQEDPTAPPKATRIRQGILTGRVDR
jgi:S1-C subfamily serine protease